MIIELNERSKQIFRQIVDSYVQTGEPIGSRTLSRRPDQLLSPATIRGVMADLEEAGLLYAPHTSAGRVPTELGLRFYVDGLLETGDLSQDDRIRIDAQCQSAGRSVEALLGEATTALSGLSRYAGLVFAPKTEHPFRHVEFVPLGPGNALAIVVTENGLVENRVVHTPLGVGPSALIEAGNFLTARLAGRSLEEAKLEIEQEMSAQQSQLDELAKKVVQAGLATWSVDNAEDGGVLIVRGQANLLEDVTRIEDLERIRSLFQALETKKTLVRLIDLLGQAAGVQIFIGAENQLFGLSGCSLVVAPYFGEAEVGQRPHLVGAIGVVGPTRMNYSRIIPMVDYTARVVSRLLGKSGTD